jgi:hypothetical protein
MSSTVWTFGPGGEFTATWDGSLTVTVTLTAGGAFLGSFAPVTTYQAALAAVAGFLPPAAAPALALVASTGPGGFALQNGTPNILTWTPPADGQLHQFQLFGELIVASTATGGALSVAFTDPGGAGRTPSVLAGSQGAGFHALTAQQLTCEAGQQVALTQSSALTGGAATLWATLWAA